MAQWLIDMNGPTGQFRYRVNLNPDVSVPPRYNELRHAGTIFALADYSLSDPQPELNDVLTRGIHFLKNACVAPVSPSSDDMLAVWSVPELVGKNGSLQAKLGGTGLGLVAFLSVERVCPGQMTLHDLQRLGRFLLYMQKADGGFYSKYIPDKSGRDDRWISLYYPGEAALGLVMLYEHDGQPEWLNAALRALGYLARIREGQPHVEADHWALLATARLVRAYAATDRSVSLEKLQQHAAQICESMLAERPGHPPSSPLHGCFSEDGRTTPTATRLEGLQAGLDVIPLHEDDRRSRIQSAVHDGIDFLWRVHQSTGEHRGAIPRAFAPLPEDHPLHTRAFNRRATEVRIDYVQHALSAMLAFIRAHPDA